MLVSSGASTLLKDNPLSVGRAGIYKIQNTCSRLDSYRVGLAGPHCSAHEEIRMGG